MIYLKFYLAMCLFTAAFIYNFCIVHENEIKGRLSGLGVTDESLQSTNFTVVSIITSILLGCIWPVFILLIFGTFNNDNS
jgi:hypothetical protein